MSRATKNETPASVSVNVDKVEVHSLPRSLRHISRSWALDDAKVLAELLLDITYAADKDFVLGSWRGVGLVIDLLIDKIEIGNGDYLFPMHGDSDGPRLAEREGGV